MDSWVLRGAKVALDRGEPVRAELEIRRGRIAAVCPPGRKKCSLRPIDLEGCLILPGLINAHEHLEFNLFPRMGNGPYPNAAAWAQDIYRPTDSPVREHLKVPKPLRLQWGGLKNLLSGVTTVCHHNPYEPRVFDGIFPVRVVSRYLWVHSLDFSPAPGRSTRLTPRDWPFILHLGEAVDRNGREEIFRLERLGLLGSRTVLVHGVALDREGLKLAAGRGASLVWCPSSNQFILGRTIRREVLGSGMPVALGTDSALSGAGDLLDEMRRARRIRTVRPGRLRAMVTVEAARILRLRDGEGTLSAGSSADLIAVRESGRDVGSTLLRMRSGDPELVMVRGHVKLAAPGLARRIPGAPALHPLVIDDRRETLVAADLPELFRRTKRILGSDLRIAGKRISLA